VRCIIQKKAGFPICVKMSICNVNGNGVVVVPCTKVVPRLAYIQTLKQRWTEDPYHGQRIPENG
jgi:hypothetical protein